MTVEWNVDNTENIAGQPVTVVGQPTIIETPEGGAVKFNGESDGIFLDALPIAGWDVFTIELFFRPDADGLAEQRFFHLQEQDDTGQDGEYRVLVETRLTPDNLWYLDTYINSAAGEQPLIDPAKTHPTGQWFHIALVYDGQRMSHYVDGVEEKSAELEFTPLNTGRCSIGVRINHVCWFKGAFRKVRFTPEALAPEQFMTE